MADTAGGSYMRDPMSEWAQFDFGQSDQPYSSLDSEFPSAAQLPQSYYHQQSNYGYPQDTHGIFYDSQGQALLPQSYANEIEHIDGVNGSRLTQAQMAALENSFIAVPKPKTDYKRILAEKLGLELSRHWFQNRRQKAKSQKQHGKQESDASSTGAPPTSIAPPLSIPTSETQISTDTISHDQTPHLVGPPFNHSMESVDEYPHVLPDQSLRTHSMAPTFDSATQNDHSLEFRDGVPTNPAWMNDLNSISVNQSLVTSTHDNRITSSLSPQSLTGSNTFITGFDGSSKEFVNPPILNNNMMGNGLINNSSSQTLESNASSLGETNNLLTPPTSTPPLPWLSSEFDARRASDSSELAHNVEGMHLQQGRQGIGLASNTASSGPSSRIVSTVGLTTPDTSPEQHITKFSAPPSDIASRRKRHRPAALHPEANRSASCASPSTLSPHARSSSISLAPPTNQVRRIQSQGQNLNNHFRVHKNTNHSAQISPRNLQTHLDKHFLAQGSKQAVLESSNLSPKIAQNILSKPSTSAASANRSPAEYQHEFPIVRPSNPWNPNTTFNMSHHANASVPDLHSGTVQTQHSLSIKVPSQPDLQYQPYHGPPQSAPPQQTAFFDDSPDIHHGPFHPPGWQEHVFTPAAQNNAGMNSTPVSQPAHFTPQEGNGYFPPFAPQFQFPQDGSPLGGYPGSTYFPAFPSGTVAGHSATPVELEIKVELGPEPKLSSKFEKFEFSHTFSDKYGQNGEKK